MNNPLLSTWVHPAVLKNSYLSSFKRGKPFSHVVIEDFFIETQAEKLLAALRAEPFFEKDADLFHFFQTNDLTSSKNKIIREFALLVESKEFSNFIVSLTGIKVKPGALDLAGSLYKPGDYLLCHDDQVEDRKIAYILYLSKGFTEKDGARFVLFNNKNGKPTTIAQSHMPHWNSLMLFEVSPLSFHMVEENLGVKDRYAIGGWLH